MKRLITFLVSMALAVLAIGCDSGGAENGAAVSSALNPDHKVLVCHPRGQSGKLPLRLEVDEHALQAHLDHGDWIGAEVEICGDSLDNDCDGVVDEDCDPCPGGKCCPEGESCEGQDEDPCTGGKC